MHAVMQELVGGRGATCPPEYFADHLTLFQPEGADSALPPLIFSLSVIPGMCTFYLVSNFYLIKNMSSQIILFRLDLLSISHA